MANYTRIKRRKSCDPEDLEDMMSGPNAGEIIDNDGPIWINKFSEDSARAFVKQLQWQSQRDPSSPIVIYVDSYGGDVYSLFTMLSAMESVPNKLITVAMGKCMSAGALVLACGDARYAAPYSTLMIHEMSAGAGGHVADMNTEYANITQLNEKLLKIMAKRCKVKGGADALKKQLDKVRDLYMTPEEAVKFGLIDGIGIPQLQRKVSVEWGLVMAVKDEEQDSKPGAKNEKPAKAKV